MKKTLLILLLVLVISTSLAKKRFLEDEKKEKEEKEKKEEKEEKEEKESDNFSYDANLKYHDCNDYINTCNGAQGKIVTETYTGINGKNSLKVYLPFNYDETKKHNIFYLMHGGGENESTLFGKDVNIQNIFDHLIKNGDMEPFIAVTPTFTKTDTGNFHKELRKDIIPLIEKKYKTYAESTSEEDIIKSRRHRAFGGFSMGAACTWFTMENCLDIIAYFMPLSGGGTPEKIINAIKKSGLTNRDYFVMAATGTDDMTYKGMTSTIDSLKKNEDLFTYTSDFSKGNLYYLVADAKTHWWGYVKHYVCLMLPYFFHE